ncbi:MAG: sulfatase-like hydrolase/transferase [Phycisphaerae bacterium]|jgi:arylsulfatase A-like enzyme|nr:sulfatase-like hydrolase/transferase [Phycisphaerae bacterium]
MAGKYTRRDFLRASAAPLVLGAAGALARAAEDKPKPNIVYIMCDELGYYELSCMAHPHFKTPNIDRLASQGVRFTQALAGSSVCAPTRGVLMTGKHSGHTSVRKNDGGTPLRADEVSVAAVLKKAGYATGGFGKWGCGGRGSTGVPEKHGFDVFVGYYDQVHAHSYYPPYILRNSEELTLAGNSGGAAGKTYSHYVIMDHAKKFIRDNKDRPFFCYLPITPPHGMFSIPDDDPAWKLFKDKPWPEPARRYSAMVNMVDRQLGEIRSLLKELSLDKNTIIFFCGDNGGMDYFRDKDHPRGFHGPNVHPKTGVTFRGQKGNLYEGGLRIPMIVHWPGHIKPARVSDLLWYFPDVLPTLAELAGGEPPKDIDGISIVPELIGEKAAKRKQKLHQYLYWEISRQKAVRMKNWKAIDPGGKGAWELYDLNTDIEEKTNLAEKHPDILAKMKTFAQQAHQPAVQGVFADRTLHEKDRRAKYGGKARPSRMRGKTNKMPKKGLIDNKDWKIVRASSESSGNGKLAKCAIDGDPRTWWHSAFGGKVREHPHELVIDLGAEYEIRGFRYLARQDSGWNGAIDKCEFYVSNTASDFKTPAVKTAFKKIRTAQDAKCKPTRGRFVLLRTLSAHGNGPWASISELGVVGK